MTDTNEAELDLLETKSQYEKFVIYLPSKFFNKSSIFKTIYQRIRKKLRYKGIMTYDIDEYAKNLILLNNYCNSIKNNLLTIASEFEHHPDVSINYFLKNKFGNEFIEQKFDDLDYPSANVLYIHLFGGYYYNDKIYAKKKFELEREILFFIAGNLGVGKITYTITNKETVITKIKSDVNIQNIRNQIQFSKTYTENNSSECTEIYENNGATILFDANGDIKKLEKEIKKSMEPINSPIFNYGFYKSNPKMVAFVCKRFLFKMNTLDYTCESEDVSEMSLTVQSCFADYGLQVAFESSTTNSEKVKYKLEFHKENNLLETYFQKKKYNDAASDPFVMIRKFYDEDKSGNKADSKNMIKKYIISLANKCEYKNKGASTTNTFSKKFDDFIRKSEVKLSIKYKNFYTTRDIKKWFVDNLLIRNKDEVADDFFDNSDYKTNGISIQLANSDLESSNLIKTYEEKIAYLESQLKDTIDKLNIFQFQNDEYLTLLELQLKETRERHIEIQTQSSNEIQIPSIENHFKSIHQSKDVSEASEASDASSLLESHSSEGLLIPVIKDLSEHIHMSNQAQTIDEPEYPQLCKLEQRASHKPSLTLSLNSLVSISPLQLTYPVITDINQLVEVEPPIMSTNVLEIESSKTVEELLKENEDKLNHYKELHKTIENMKAEIKNKNEQLEKSKNANKDKITEHLIELSSSQNALQSLRSQRVMEQIKQTSINKNLDDEQYTFNKLKGIFTRASTIVNNIDKQINKTTDKCKKLEEDITWNKYELETKQNEIYQLTRTYDENLEAQSNLEQELLDKGLTIEQLYDMLVQSESRVSNVNIISNTAPEPRNSSISLNDSKKSINENNKYDRDTYFFRTFSNQNQENVVITSV